MKNDEIALYENERISTVVDLAGVLFDLSLYENERISTVVDLYGQRSDSSFMRMKEFLLL